VVIRMQPNGSRRVGSGVKGDRSPVGETALLLLLLLLLLRLRVGLAASPSSFSCC
jgi:hypothetical protein